MLVVSVELEVNTLFSLVAMALLIGKFDSVEMIA